jgi:hypothetical protein
MTTDILANLSLATPKVSVERPLCRNSAAKTAAMAQHSRRT